MTDNFGNLIKEKNTCFLTVRLSKTQHDAFRDAARKTETSSISGVLRELVLAFVDNRVSIRRKQVHRSIFDAPTLDDYLQTVALEDVDSL